MAYKTCEDCGCRIIGGHCTNCHEEFHIMNQYLDDGIELPSDKTEFMQKAIAQSAKESVPETRNF